VTISVSLGGITLERTALWRDRARVRREMLDELRAALDEHEVLRPRVDTVPGSSIPYVDDLDWGSKRRLGFT
jgi:hypothetical protein